MDLDKRIIDLTLGELLEILQIKAEERTITEDYTDGEFVSGIDGLARIFNVSRTTAQAIKNSGDIDEAIIQVGARRFMVDVRKAIELRDKQMRLNK